MKASAHYKIAECGRLARVSAPYKNKVGRKIKFGIGFDFVDIGGYVRFNHRHEKTGKTFSIRSHRMVYFLHHKELPEFIDHIDGDKTNNNILNLRGATALENNRNKRSQAGATSEYLGVSWNKRLSKWVAQLKTCGKNKYIGCFTSENEAALAYNTEALSVFGEFANLNKLR